MEACQQQVATFQQLPSEKELHKQLLLQTQLIDQLQQEEAQGKVVAKMACQELQETQEHLGSHQPAEAAATGPADLHGSPWGRRWTGQ